MKKLYILAALVLISVAGAKAQKSIGINTNDPKSTFDVNGNLALREGPSLVLANGGASGGVNDNIVLPDITGLSGVKASFYRITGPSAAFSIYGVVPNSGADGQLVTLLNTTTNVMTVKNNASSIPANSIKTLSGADMVTVAGMSSITLQYNKTDARWYVTGSENFTVSSTSLPTKDIVPGTGSAITVVNGANQVVGGGNVVVDVQTNGLGQKGIVPGPTGLNSSQVWGTDGGGNPAWAKVQNAQLQNSSVTVNTGTGLSGGGNVALGGTLNLTNTAPDQTVTLTNGTGISATGTYPNFTITNTAPDQTVVLNSGTGISATGTYPNFTITNTGDLSTTNEGSLTVGAGTATTSLISSNTSGSTPVTLQAGSNVTLSEAGNTITIASSNSGGTVTSIATTAPITGGTITTSGTIGLTQLGDVLAGTGVSVSGGTDKLPGNADVTITNTGVTSIAGTPNQVIVNQATGAVTLSTPQNIHTGANVTFNSVTAPNDFFGRINIIDTRNSDFAPNTFDNEVAFEFKARGSIAGTPGSGTYGGLMTLAPWGDNSGDLHHQLFFNNGGIFYRTGQPDNTSWNGWSQVLTSGNISSNINGTTNYVPKFTSANTIGNSLVYDNGTGIGIGTTGSARLHVSGGGMILGTNGVTSNTRTLTILEDGDAQTNFGSYPGQWTSALQIQDNTTSRFVWLSPLDNASGANARLVSAGSGFDIYTNTSTQAMSLSAAGAATFPSLSAGGLVKSSGGTLQIAGGGDLPAGSGNYIQNQYGGAQSANMWISGETRTGNWFRNSASGTGLYNEATGAGVYSPSGGLMSTYNGSNFRIEGQRLYGSGSSSTYGALTIQGDKAGWGGISFRDAAGNLQKTFMITSTYSGIYNSSDNNWDWLFNSGSLQTLNTYSPANNVMRLTPNLHLNALAGYAVILNWDNGAVSAGTQQLRIGNGQGSDMFGVLGNGDVTIQNKLALRGDDSWLRLNQNSNFGSGTYTPGFFRADQGVATAGLANAYGGVYGVNSPYYHTNINDSWLPYPGNSYNYFRGNAYAWNAHWYDENNAGYYMNLDNTTRIAYLYYGVGAYGGSGWLSGIMQTENTSDGHQYVPLTGNWGYVGTSGQYWFYMYSNNYVDVSGRPETKKHYRG